MIHITQHTVAPHSSAPTTDRPTAPAPIWHQIPAELQARKQWVCWRYEWREKGGQGKSTKVPFNARTAKNASSTAPRTWSSFHDAKDAYLNRPDYYDGIGYVFSKDDPYCGVDFDHCIDAAGVISSWAAERIAQMRAAGAYIEVSVSGSGVHAITRAVLPGGKGIKKPAGEIYDRKRFFTFSGNVLAGSTPIGDGQAPIDALYAELGGAASSDKPARDGVGGNCDRAALAASHPESEWEEARQLARTKRDLLLKRSLLATQKEVTQPRGGQPPQVNQGYYATRLLWAELHRLLPNIGLYRADGTLDNSQTYAVLARALYGRGFTFPEYVVIMSHHFAAQALAKWGDKQHWREDLASCWQHAIDNTRYTPRSASQARKSDVAIVAKPRGRASNHTEQVERVYTLLLDHRAGAQAPIQTAELASAAGIHRVTLAGILAELRSAGRITTTRNGRYGGLIVSFPDVVIPVAAPTNTPATVADQPIPDVVILFAPEAAQPIATAQTAIEPPAAIEETRVPNSTNCVSSDRAEAGYSSQEVDQAPDLATLATDYLARPADEVGRRCKPNKQTGALVYRHDMRHFAALVVSYGYSTEQAYAAYKAEQQRLVELAKAAQTHRRAEQAQRKAAQEAEKKAEWARFFAKLKAMSNDELIAYINGGCKRELAELARNDTASLFDRHKYNVRLKCARQQLAWRGVEMPKKATRLKPVKTLGNVAWTNVQVYLEQGEHDRLAEMCKLFYGAPLPLVLAEARRRWPHLAQPHQAALL